MGVDVQIYIKVKDGVTERIENNTQVEGEFTPLDRSYYDEWELVSVTHELTSMTRYYGEGYARGPWPQISALLLELLMDDRVEKVWYCGDCSIPDTRYSEFALDDLHALNRYYVQHGHSEYGNGDRRR